MSDEPRKLTIRIGDRVFTNVKDYVVLIRNEDNTVNSEASSRYWAHGAMESEIAGYQHMNQIQAEQDHPKDE